MLQLTANEIYRDIRDCGILLRISITEFFEAQIRIENSLRGSHVFPGRNSSTPTCRQTDRPSCEEHSPRRKIAHQTRWERLPGTRSVADRISYPERSRQTRHCSRSRPLRVVGIVDVAVRRTAHTDHGNGIHEIARAKKRVENERGHKGHASG